MRPLFVVRVSLCCAGIALEGYAPDFARPTSRLACVLIRSLDLTDLEGAP
ncbi:MAG: hypothetical protein WB586_00295 [Chthoniobacterales bacterium]